MATKTITLTGAEVAVTGLDGANAHIRNDGTGTIYAAKTAGITAGADGVMSIPTGQSATVYGISGTVYLLGGGSATVVSSDYVESPFKSSVTIGAVTEIVSGAVSNPNLLINHDFAINQRGETEYSGNYTYGVDHWQCQNDGVMTVTGDGIKVGFLPSVSSGGKSIIRQCIENCESLCGKTCTLSVYIKDLSSVGAQLLIMATKIDGSMVYPGSKRITSDGIITLTFIVPDDISALYVWLYGADMRVAGETANSYTVFRWAKLEIGGVATQFTRPDQVVELARCQRYLQKLSAYSVYRAVYVHTNYIDFSIPTPTSMRAGTISITGTPEVMPFPISSPVSGFSFAVQIYGQNQLLLRATKSAHGLTDAVLRVPPGTEILLSAEP